ncbi:Lipocalin-like domain-containing protein [Rhizobium sp. NFR07]|uniref:lipocalin-like domain-containing protein n=1 Tax=Rhizobium sp. NFR07 TaxID=1566262 RepID=UPI0008E64ED7|nr:lipocalin-like domain-containing protein [Rhizobium sp. NFR07]SFB42828.1 Lipocalin-like domain-containing protein [Rhizobium sp. NFR07]
MNKKSIAVSLGLAVALSIAGAPAWADSPNRMVGTWRMVSAYLDPDGVRRPAYGPSPHGWLVFTEELTFVEVLTDPRVPRFVSGVRGEGTDAENRAAMAGGIGFFGRYSVDEDGNFSGNRVEGSTFPNWVGSVRTRDDLQIVVSGDRMTENFRRPEGTEVEIIFERVR